nr:MAG TPA: hypothetical protein [Caudoviricetes sp.]
MFCCCCVIVFCCWKLLLYAFTKLIFITLVGNDLIIITHISTNKIMFAGSIIIMAIDVGSPYFIAILMVECAQYSLEGNKVLMFLGDFESRPVSVLFRREQNTLSFGVKFSVRQEIPVPCVTITYNAKIFNMVTNLYKLTLSTDRRPQFCSLGSIF